MREITSVATGTDTVRSFVDGRVGVIELNRPERRNALHADMYDAIPRLIELFNADNGVAVIMTTAAGTAFCAGGDVQTGGARSRPVDPPTDTAPVRPDVTAADVSNPLAHMARMVLMLQGSPKITMAALPGPAVGAGIGIALAADLRIAAESATLITGWGRLGFSGDFGGTWFLTRMLGPARALEALIGNETIDAVEAKALGMFNRVVPDEQLASAAMAWAQTIAEGPQSAYRFMKQNVRDAQRLSLTEALPLESDRMVRSGQTDDHRQAVKRWLAQAKAKHAAES
ncbi:MAG: crt 1 [Mycobacterium sp.]|nr:crt 1 [Mycobacterium sp.]